MACRPYGCFPAAEHEAYTRQAQASLWNEPWRISPQSDRYRFRLESTPLMPKVPLELRSHGIVPGVIQVPHGGQPLVQMRDAPAVRRLSRDRNRYRGRLVAFRAGADQQPHPLCRGNLG